MAKPAQFTRLSGRVATAAVLASNLGKAVGIEVGRDTVLLSTLVVLDTKSPTLVTVGKHRPCVCLREKFLFDARAKATSSRCRS